MREDVCAWRPADVGTRGCVCVRTCVRGGAEACVREDMGVCVLVCSGRPGWAAPEGLPPDHLVARRGEYDSLTLTPSAS